MHRYLSIIGLWLLLWASNGHAANLELTDQAQTISALPHVEVFEDQTTHMGIEQVVRQNFQPHPITKQQLSFGRTHSNLWFRFQVTDQSAEQWYLSFGEMLHGTFEVHFLNQALKPLLSNVAHPIKLHNPTWSLHLPKQEAIWVYAKVNNGSAALNFTANFSTVDTFVIQSSDYYTYFTVSNTAILILALYHLILGFSLREPSYISLSVLSFATFLTQHRITPTFDWVVFADNTTSHFSAAFVFLMLAPLTLFTKQILQTHLHFPRLDKVLKAVVIWCVVSFFIQGFIPSAALVNLQVTASLFGVFLLVLGINFWAAKKGSKIALIFFVIFLLITMIRMPFIISYIANEGAWGQQDILWLNAGNVVFVLLLALVQAHQMRLLQHKATTEKARNEAKDQFLASMSHELRTPMHTITGYTQLLQQSKLSETQQKHLSHLSHASQHMQGLISNVLDTAIIKNKKLVLANDAFTLQDIQNTLCAMFEDEAKKKGIEFKFNINNPQDNVVGDRMRLLQVLINLISNSLKYTQEGKITITIRAAALDQAHTNICFFVKDTGIGIPKHKLTQLFDPFTQLNTTDNHYYSGLGLGLAISHQLVDMMGGQLEAKSAEGQGSLFRFSINLKRHIESSSSLYFQKKVKVLLVDDCAINLALGKQILANMGASVITASSGQQAIEKLKTSVFDIALLDINMPDMNGFELSHWIRTFKKTAVLPIVALSAHSKQSILERYEQSQINDFLQKPFEAKGLYQMIQQWAEPSVH